MGRRAISSSERKTRQRFGKLLSDRRQSIGLGLREAARIANINHTTLSRIENGERPCSLKDLPKLENAYQVPLEALQIARNYQIPSALIRSLFEPTKTRDGKTEVFTVRTTPEEKRELTVFLGYLRFAQE